MRIERCPGLTLVLHLVASATFVTACASDPPPKKEPPKCARVDSFTDTVVEEVVCAGLDRDRDGVDDAVDHCPNHAETDNGLFDRDGCPDPDADQDRLSDTVDACPHEAGPPPDGCPIADTDGDGIADHLDACPTKAEDIDGEDDADGCPEGDRLLAKGEVLEVWPAVTLEYRHRKAELSEAGARALSVWLDRLGGRASDVVRVQIQAMMGGKEPRGRAAQELAIARGELLRGAVLALGIPPSRIEMMATVDDGASSSPLGGASLVVELASRGTTLPPTDDLPPPPPDAGSPF